MRVTLNLATNPATGRRAFWVAASLLGSIVLLLTIAVGVQGWRAWRGGPNPRARSGELRSQLADIAERQRDSEVRLRAPAARVVLERAAFYNQLLQRRAVSWAQLFVALERHLPARVRILAVTPELAEEGQLRLKLRVGAESPAALFAFLRDLERGPEFTGVAVSSQDSAERSGGSGTVAEVTATYRGGE